MILGHHSVVARTNVLVLGLVGRGTSRCVLRSARLHFTSALRELPGFGTGLGTFSMRGSAAKPEGHLRTSGSGVDWDKLGDFNVRTAFMVYDKIFRMFAGLADDRIASR